MACKFDRTPTNRARYGQSPIPETASYNSLIEDVMAII